MSIASICKERMYEVYLFRGIDGPMLIDDRFRRESAILTNYRSRILLQDRQDRYRARKEEDQATAMGYCRHGTFPLGI
jgi:hypothetical protein